MPELSRSDDGARRPYCTFRNRRTCTGPVVITIAKQRFRLGRWETFHYGLCAYHEKVAKRG